MKKTLAILLSLLMLVSLSTTCFAAGNEAKITGIAAKINSIAASLEEKIADAAGSLTIDGDQNLDAVVASSFADLNVKAEYDSGAAPSSIKKAAALSKTQTLKSAASDYSKYLFIPVENPDEVAAIIAESCEFDYSLVSDGKGTVYIKVNVEENPEIFNFSVFRNLVDQLYAGEKEEMIKNDDGSTDYLMSYEHIAGELALHMIVYAATSSIIELSGSGNETILNLYNSAKLAELNYDESRMPSKWIFAIGRLITVMFRFDVFRIFNAA